MDVRREVFFIDGRAGQRFCVLTRPVGMPRGGVLFVHPFAEELNKSRRMVSLAAQAFAASGWMVLQIDLHGCGDSAGDFGDACWQGWVDDVALGWSWLRAHCEGPRVLWSLRAGSLLAADWLHGPALEQPALLMWQPVSDGRQHLTQFLRLKAAGEMLADADARQAMSLLRESLQRGDGVEVAGYGLSAALAAGLDAASLRLPPGYSAPVALLEVDSRPQPELSPALARLTERLTKAGNLVRSEAVSGAAFWQTQEIETAPAMIEASLRMLERVAA